MDKISDTTEQNKDLQEIMHVVGQIEKLKQNISNKLDNKRYPDQQVLEVLADAMKAVDEITEIHPQNSGLTQIYAELNQGKIADNLCDKISEWQKETLNWVDYWVKHIESRRLIQALQEEVQRQSELIQKLAGNKNVIRGWYSEINREKISYELEIDHSLGITTQKRDRQVIVSLTSYPDRMYELKYILYSLLHQSMKPDRIILWLAEEQFPNKEDDIAPSLLALQENGISIAWCEDIKSYKKLIPALKMYPEDIIVTADDDIYYPENWLELLYNSYLKHPDCIHCHRAHRIKITDNGFAPYNSWETAVSIAYPTRLAFPTSGAGTLYPPHTLHKDILCKEYFMELAPKADDIWFWTMGLLNGTRIQIVPEGIRNILSVNWSKELGLTGETTLSAWNVVLRQNDTYLNRVLTKYPQILEILHSEEECEQSMCISSAEYWEQRYLHGGTSGSGSYNRLADFKARVINQFVRDESINTVIEWGCGDGNQLKLADYPRYVGYDVSEEAVIKCRERFREDNTKKFIWSGASDFVSDIKAELALSLDVVYHLVEDDVFDLYMRRLFESSTKYVCIYSCNFNKFAAPHVRCRKFTDYIDSRMSDWKLIKEIKNEYPYDENDPNNTSWSDFYIYQHVDD